VEVVEVLVERVLGVQHSATCRLMDHSTSTTFLSSCSAPTSSASRNVHPSLLRLTVSHPATTYLYGKHKLIIILGGPQKNG